MPPLLFHRHDANAHSRSLEPQSWLARCSCAIPSRRRLDLVSVGRGRASCGSPGAASDKHALARLLLAIRTRDASAYTNALQEARRQFGQPLLAAGKPSFAAIYDSVLQLQVTDDLDAIYRSPSADALTMMLSKRIEQTLPSFRTREVLLSAYRSGMKACGIDGTSTPLSTAWIQTSKQARRAGHLQTAYSAVLQAARLENQFAFIQRAKLLLSEDQMQPAIQVMNNSLTQFDHLDARGLGENRQSIAKAYLLRSSIIEASGRFVRNDVLESYRKAAKLDETTEKAWYRLGHYADVSRESGESNNFVIDARVVQWLLRALNRGTKYFFRTLPRILTIWLDGGEQPWIVQACSSGSVAVTTDEMVNGFKDTCSLIRKAIGALPGYQVSIAPPRLTPFAGLASD